MSDFMLQRTVAANQLARSVIQGIVEYASRTATRVRNEQSGQDLVEYAGVLLIVGLIVVAVMKLHIDTTVSGAVSKALKEILG
jgi:Flp pilus assembly pilin Flp